MPPSHPSPEHLASLSEALTTTGDHAAAGGDDLLDHLVTVGDHTTQAALESLIDDAVDVLREVSATCRELTLSVRATTPSAATAARPDVASAPEVRQR